MSVDFKIVRNDLNKWIDRMLRASDYFDVWAARELPRLYSNAQRKRFMTQGSSEGSPWDPPKSRSYLKWKKRYFDSWPGGGRRTQIASSRLLSGILPPSERQGVFMGPFPERRKTKSGRVVHDSGYWRNLRSKWGKEFRAVQGRGNVQYMTAVPYAREASERNDFERFSKKTSNQFAASFAGVLKAGTLRDTKK